MTGECRIVAVWVGHFPSATRLEQYLAEQYDDDDRPISEFAADQGEAFYDHDWVESGFRASQSARVLLRGHSFSESYLPAVEAAVEQHAAADMNTVLLVWNNEIQSPRSATGLDYTLIFLGSFPCDPTSRERSS